MNRELASPHSLKEPSLFDLEAVRRDFPILNEEIHGHPLVYLDNAASTQRPRAVIEATTHFYEHDNSNVHRGVHLLSQRATESYEDARVRIQRFLNAPEPRQIIFVRGVTEAVNLVAQTWGRTHVSEGDEIVISEMEHHSNIVPWQLLCQQTGGRLRVVPVNDAGELEMDEYERLLGDRTRIVAVTYISNALGTINPVREITRLAHERGAAVVIDGAQAAPHLRLDVQDLDCDFFAFSGHKVYGPTGIGVLYGRAGLLEQMPPYQGGGDMISSVSFEETLYNVIPHKFEAGTPNIAGVVGLAAALEYVESIGRENIAAHEGELLRFGTDKLQAVPRLRMIGTAREKASVMSFVMEGIHAHDIGTILDQEGIAVRTGHHCAQPLMQRFGVAATARASIGLYNTRREIDALAEGLNRVVEVFR